MRYEYTTTLLTPDRASAHSRYSKLNLPDNSGQWRLVQVADSIAFWEKLITDTPRDIFATKI